MSKEITLGMGENIMKHSLKTGLCFGTTSGIITTLGLIVGLHSFTRSKLVIIGGIFTIAVADAFSDALGIQFLKKLKTSILKERFGSQQYPRFSASLFLR